MKKILLRTLILSFIPFLSFSQTQVSGNIKKNTIWTKANSPYVLTGPVGVPAAYTLTIEPGVEVQRTEGSQQIIVNGAVIFNGVESDSITFSTSNFSTAIPFLDFEKSILNNSSIRFLRFINQNPIVYNLRVGWEIPGVETSPKNSGILKISRSNLSNGYIETHGVMAAKSVDIDSCNLRNVNVSVGYSTSERINISNSTISRSTISSYYDYGISINNCNADNTKFNCKYTIDFMSSRVKYCSLNGNVTIENSIFLNTTCNLSNLYMKNTKFIISDKNLSIGYHGRDYTIVTDGTTEILGCEFIGVNASNCLSVDNASISNNNFSGFKNYIDVYIASNISISNNSFNSTSQYAIANYSANNISATGNYFELKPEQTVDDIIYDNDDNLSYGQINYTPYLTTPVTTAAITRPKNATKEVSNGSVVVKWNKNAETNVINYKVYTGYVDPFTYSDTATVAATDSVLVLNGVSITDSIAVTASKISSTGRGNEQVVNESWFSPALLTESVLPVKLISFNAVSLNDKNQVLWEISNEVNNDHFDIEYGMDGINFTKIGAVNNSNSHSYSFIHNNPSNGVNYYRLKQVDKDGHFEYSKIVKVKFTGKKRITLYPSPATETINIVSSVAIVNASLINELGQRIKEINGNNALQLKVNINGLPKGVYRILINNQKQEKDNITFIKQ